jgi:hypothetical protein
MPRAPTFHIAVADTEYGSCDKQGNAMLTVLPKRVYRVSRRDLAWMISLDGREYGPYPSKTEAVKEAQNCARSDRESGREAEVIQEN